MKKTPWPVSPVGIFGKLCDMGWLREQKANFRRNFAIPRKEFLQRGKSGSMTWGKRGTGG